MKGSINYVSLFQKLGNLNDLSNDIVCEIEKFFCHLHGNKLLSSVVEKRNVKKTGNSTIRLSYAYTSKMIDFSQLRIISILAIICVLELTNRNLLL